MKKIKDLIYKIKESTRLQLIVGAISVGLIATGVVGVIAYKNSNNSLASSGEVEEVNESEADIILTENESGELVATDKEGKEYTIKAKAVVIAAGGFSANQEMVVQKKADLKGFATTNHNGATGDAVW